MQIFKADKDMIGFILSTHGSFGRVNADGGWDEGLVVHFSCGNTSRIDELFQENLANVRRM